MEANINVIFSHVNCVRKFFFFLFFWSFNLLANYHRLGLRKPPPVCGKGVAFGGVVFFLSPWMAYSLTESVIHTYINVICTYIHTYIQTYKRITDLDPPQ